MEEQPFASRVTHHYGKPTYFRCLHCSGKVTAIARVVMPTGICLDCLRKMVAEAWWPVERWCVFCGQRRPCRPMGDSSEGWAGVCEMCAKDRLARFAELPPPAPRQFALPGVVG